MSAIIKETLLRRQQVQEACKFSRSTLWAKVKNRTFPAPVKTGIRSRLWTATSINLWIAEQIEASRVGAV